MRVETASAPNQRGGTSIIIDLKRYADGLRMEL